MPIYEYRCDACGHQDEFLQKVSEPPLTDCPACHKSTFTKQLSVAGFQLKGSGWYATDFKNKAKPAEKKVEGKAEAEGGVKSGEAKSGEAKSGEGKSEAASETKPGSKPKSEASAA